MSFAEGFQIVGLLLDIAGVVLVWLFGVLPAFDAQGGEAVVTRTTNDAKHRARYHLILGRFGLCLLIAGFGLQVVGILLD